jgi:hypothetical protein
MKIIHRSVYSLFILSLFSCNIIAQPDIEKICKIEDGRMIFTIDTKWSEERKKEISRLFLIDSIVIENAINRIPEFTFDSIIWGTAEFDSRFVFLFTILDKNVKDPITKLDLTNTSKPYFYLNPLNNINSIKYGVNHFVNPYAFKSDSVASIFFLKGYENAQSVYLSGTFNNWSTMETPLQKNDSGWSIGLKLEPGKYLYKYIIDGKWSIDPNNKEKEPNEHGTFNSVVFVYNHSFFLPGFEKAKKVFVSGIFNNWNPKYMPMTKTSGGWKLDLFLSDGSYSYKFIVDRNWMTDPLNPVKKIDASGNENSFIEIGNKITIELKGYTHVKTMILSGSFNNWDHTELCMNKNDSGWALDYVIGPGNYEYKYIADGEWMIDSLNPYSIYTGGFRNSVFTVNPNHSFRLSGFENAENVIVTGTFNDWNTSGYTMKKENGIWSIPLFLNKGKHLYKFIVDGEWMLDPQNPIWENNEVGTGNSVLWIE